MLTTTLVFTISVIQISRGAIDFPPAAVCRICQIVFKTHQLVLRPEHMMVLQHNTLSRWPWEVKTKKMWWWIILHTSLWKTFLKITTFDIYNLTMPILASKLTLKKLAVIKILSLILVNIPSQNIISFKRENSKIQVKVRISFFLLLLVSMTNGLYLTKTF